MSRTGQAWGIPLPHDSDSVVYVWVDALINYLSAVGFGTDDELFETWWPASLHVIGKDITRFHCVIWPAMLMSAGLALPDQVFGHGWVHWKGQKMSKSKGNVIDPLTKMSQYGTDALRFTLTSMTSPGRDIKLSEERIEGYRNFTNKIWNAARFILMNTGKKTEAVAFPDRPLIDRWILTRLNQVIESVNSCLEDYRFDQAASQLYHFTWHEYCCLLYTSDAADE